MFKGVALGFLFLGAGKVVEKVSGKIIKSFTKRGDEIIEASAKGIDDVVEPLGTCRDAQGKLRNKDGTFAKDSNTVKFNRNTSERKKALLRDAKDPNSGLSDRARKQILDSNGENVPKGHEVSHEIPLYTEKTVTGKKALDRASNMKTQQKNVHRKRHKKCGDQFHDFPF